jgi:predicted ATPase
VTPRAGISLTASITDALSGRRVLLLLDNCEHLLDAAAEFVDALLSRTGSVKVLASSREGLRLPAEHLWSVPSLDIADGSGSAAVALFVERAEAANAAFGLDDDSDATAVVEICLRLDGIALAIELAAARMVAMSAQDLCDHLGDRFRLLSGSRRGLERHQTLRQAVQWSYDLLGDDERKVLASCSVFAAGFDLAAAAHVCERFDEYAVLDVLESLVRKSLLTVEHAGRHARYAMLETIRQFAEEQLATVGDSADVRARHAAYYAAQAVDRWELWEGPGYRAAVDWVDAELANLRAGFRWAADHADVVTATAIAAHAASLGWLLQLFEPTGWAEEILPAARTADIPQLPRLYAAACLGSWTGRAEAADAFGQTAVALAGEARYDPFDPGLSRMLAAIAHVTAGGDVDAFLETGADLANGPGLSRLAGLNMVLYTLPGVGRADEARAIAAETLGVARAHGNPYWIAFALIGTGRAFADSDPARALDAFRQALILTQEQRIPFLEARAAYEAAGLETTHGNPSKGLDLLDSSLDAYQRAGNYLDLALTLAELTAFFDRQAQPETAAIIYGTSSHYYTATTVPVVLTLPATLDHLRVVLGDAVYDERVAVGAAMDPAEGVRYAREQIRLAHSTLSGSP